MRAFLLIAVWLLGVAQAAPPALEFDSFTIRSRILQEQRTIWVGIPENYRQSHSSYPVLYATDAESKLIDLAAATRFLARNRRMPPALIVGIVNTARTRDLTPTAWRFDGSGSADQFLKFIETELVPQVDKRYRTTPYRAFVGHSFGGLFALHALTTRPALFRGVIAISPSLNWDERLPIRGLAGLIESSKQLPQSLFVSLGNEGKELAECWRELESIAPPARAKGMSVELRYFPDEDHGSIVLPSIYYGLRSLFADWMVPTEPDSGQYTLDLAGVMAHFERLGDKLGARVPVPELVLNQLGYQDLAAGHHAKALESFELMCQLYPDSANAHDSLAEGLAASGDRQRAVQTAQRAVALATQQNLPELAQFKQRLALWRAGQPATKP
jgi:hypothetical protein